MSAIKVSNVKKQFRVYLDKGSSLKERFLSFKRNKYEVRTVLNGVSFEVGRGEAVGLIGHNGCGKSTLLKLLTRIMYPNEGNIEMNGRVSSLIELGAGFHPDMSGRENIYINAAIFGLTKREIDARLDDIIAFSELEEFIDNPVRTYSSGMYMRLAFSVAINVDADILLIDEILAVGDANFQMKCFNRLREIKQQGVTIVLVSHALSQIEQICDRTIWIQDGLIRMDGKPRDVHMAYSGFMGEKRQEVAKKEEERKRKEEERKKKEEEHKKKEEEKKRREEEERKEAEKNPGLGLPGKVKRWGNGLAKIGNVCMKNAAGEERIVFTTGESVTIEMHYQVQQPVEDAVFGFGIFRVDGVQCYGSNTRIDRYDKFDLGQDGVLRVQVDSLDLMPGAYMLDVTIEQEMEVPVDYYRDAVRFEMHSPYSDVGVSRLQHTFTWEEEENE
ncbi:ABC transporter ATP-binding protein [Christensenellaceae bacterium 44-20]